MKSVKVYTTNWCAFCVRAKKLLADRNIEFEEVNVEGDDEMRVWLVNQTGQKTVPQIFIGEKPIGGYAELSGLDRSGELLAMLDKASG